MEDVFGTGNAGLAEPSDEELGIGIDEPGGDAAPAGPDAPEGDDGLDEDAGDGEPGGGREEHPQGRAFRTMREKLAASERELSRLREVEKEKIRYEERMRLFAEQRQRDEAQRRAAAEAEAARRAAAEDPEPNKDEDILAWQEWRIRQLDRRLDSEAQARQAQHAQQVEQARMQVLSRIAGEYTAWENRFALERPDYQHAFNHVASYYAHQYRLRGVQEDRIVAALEDERARLIRDCLQIDQQSGNYSWVRNPAAIIYQLAQSLGYGGPAQPDDGGEQEAPPPPMAARRDPRAERLGRSVAAAGRNGSPGRSGGVPRSQQWTLERFNELSDTEAQRFMEQYPELAQELMSPHG